jgi:transcriptional regulator of heat shock response
MDCIPKREQKSKERMAVLEHKGQFNFWLDKCNQILSDMSKYIFVQSATHKETIAKLV